MEKWEYKTLEFTATGVMGGILDMESFQRELNNMGSSGWELVTCFDTNMSHGQTRFIVAVFKRRRSL